MTSLLFIDFDHENERHAEIELLPGLRVAIDRSIETNADYLAADAEAPDDWSYSRELGFATADDARAFVSALADRLLDQCFAFFDDDEEVDDSDDARDAIAELLEGYGAGESGGADGVPTDAFAALIGELTDYPR
jgi:hypothetical protein